MRIVALDVACSLELRLAGQHAPVFKLVIPYRADHPVMISRSQSLLNMRTWHRIDRPHVSLRKVEMTSRPVKSELTAATDDLVAYLHTRADDIGRLLAQRYRDEIVEYRSLPDGFIEEDVAPTTR